MSPEEFNFPIFFSAKVKDRGMSLKRLSEVTGIAPTHLENLMHGKFNDLPSAPYFHGYLVRLGKVLDFDGEAWWEKLREQGVVKNSGSADMLPKNRFLKQSPTKFVWAGIAVAIIIIYLAFQLPVIFGKPTVSITFPDQNPYTTTSSTLTLEGTAHGASSLYLQELNGAEDTITIAPDGSWQKTVLLQDGPNTFEIVGTKLLGGQTDFTEQIFYQSPFALSVALSGSSTIPASTTFSQ